MHDNPEQPVRTVVVVNDDITQLSVLTGLLRKANIDCLPCASAEEAFLIMSESEPPALIITDVYMPEVDGWHFCNLLRSPEHKAFNQVPILVVSAIAEGEEPHRIAMDLGATAFLPAPVDGQRFIEKIQELLNGERTEKALRVLIVEDSRFLSDTLKKAFETNGYQVDTAFSTKEAATLFAVAPYDVAVMDYHLPDGCGDDLLDGFHLQQPECTCIMMTADPQPELALEWINRGASFYVRKPFDPEYLIELCERSRRERALLRVQEMMSAQTDELLERSDRHRIILQATTDLFIMTDIQGHIKEVNDACCRLIGYSEQELLNMQFADLDAAMTGQEVAQQFKRIVSRGQDRFETLLRRKDGILFSVETSVQWRAAEGGQLLIFMHDISETKKFKKNLEESERRLKDIIDFLPDPTFVVDSERKITIWNKAIESMTGAKAKDMAGKGDFEYSVPFYGERRRQLLDLLWEPDLEKELALKYKYIHREGNILTAEVFSKSLYGGRGAHVAAIVSPLYDQEGNITGAIECIRDITAKKQVVEQVENSERKYRALFENSQDAIFIFDEDGKPIDSNSVALKMFGCSREELAAKGPLYFTPQFQPDGITTKQDVFKKLNAAQNGTPQRFAWQHQRPDGTLFDVDMSFTLMEISGQKWVQGTARNITQQKIAERSLHKSEARYRALVENQIEAVCRWRPDTNLTYANEAFCRLFNKTREELLGQPFMSLVPKNSDGKIMHQVKEVVDSRGEMHYEYETQSGTHLRWIRWSDCPILDADGKLIEIQSVGVDITDRKKNELSLLAQQEQLKQLTVELTLAEERERQAIATELHDTVGQKLAIIKMNLDSLIENSSPQEVPNQAIQTVRALVEESIAETRSLTFEISPPILHLVGLEATLLALCEKYEEENSFVVEFEYEKEKSLQIDNFLRGMLYRIVRELLHNVTKYANANHVLVSFKQIANIIELYVEDDGDGFDPETLWAQREKRACLGLHSIKQRIEYFGGTMQIAAEVGFGTKVVLRVPIQSESHL